MPLKIKNKSPITSAISVSVTIDCFTNINVNVNSVDIKCTFATSSIKLNQACAFYITMYRRCLELFCSIA